MSVINYIRKNTSLIVGGGLFAIVIAYVVSDRIRDSSAHLSPNAFKAARENSHLENGNAFIENANIDGVPGLETVLNYVDPNGDYQQLEMRLDDNGVPYVVQPQEPISP